MTDADMLEALHLLDHEGLTSAQVARRLRVTRNSILGLRFRTRHESLRHFPDTADDGSLPPRWWMREGRV